MPERAALDYLFEIDEVPSYRFDVLQCVFNCISYTLEHKRNDTAIKEAYENMLIDCDAKHVDRLTDELFKIAEDAKQDLLTPVIGGVIMSEKDDFDDKACCSESTHYQKPIAIGPMEIGIDLSSLVLFGKKIDFNPNNEFHHVVSEAGYDLYLRVIEIATAEQVDNIAKCVPIAQIALNVKNRALELFADKNFMNGLKLEDDLGL